MNNAQITENAYKKTLFVLNNRNTLYNALFWEKRQNKPINESLLEQLSFLINSKQFY